jgi:peptidoglycan/xylan/chitin deacetylase (PgdA/CDA1 family)
MLPDRNWWRWSMKVALASTISHVSDLPVLSMRVRAQRRPLILGYHRVVEDFAAESRTEMGSMLTSTAMFERHLEWLGRRFRFVSLDEIAAHALDDKPFDSPVAAITFDDGYRDVYEQAFPILQRMGIPAAIFIVTDLVGQDDWQTHDKLYYLLGKAYARWDDPRRELFGVMAELDLPTLAVLPPRATQSPFSTVGALLPSLSNTDVHRVMTALEAMVGNGRHDIPRSLTWPMVTRMRRAGLTIGSHTRTHVSLPAESPDSAFDELASSKSALERQLDEPIEHFAYPGGQFTPAVVDTAVRAGYRFAYTACPHCDSRHPTMTLERLLLWEGSSRDASGRFSPAVFNCQVHDLWPPARRCERIHHS